MDAGLLYELIGYLASILVALSLTMRSILKLRVINPACTGVPIAVKMLPARLGLRWLTFISEPNAALPGGQFKKAPMLATDSASTTPTPPCR